MHKFLRAIGFSDITKKDLEILIEGIKEKPEIMKVTTDSEGNEFGEFSREFAPNMGIIVRGTYLEDDSFEAEYYTPYYFGSQMTTFEPIEIQKHSEKESYAGVCDDPRIGVTLIFYLQNVADYLSEKRTHDANILNGAMLSGLSVEGKILLPEEKKAAKASKVKQKDRSQLVSEARDGDEEAIESLTLEDMDMYSILSRRVMKEDILTIVSSYFMPYGIESDQYSVLAEIIDLIESENSLTNEVIYSMKLKCNDMYFDICINKNDLVGEPAIGRRFKGNIWMQGTVCL